MNKIILTGGAGFIGSNFLKTIASNQTDTEFVVVDALTYAGHYSTIEQEIKTHPHLSFKKIDIRNNHEVEELFKNDRYSGLIHFAAESHVDNSITNPNTFVETNVLGTLNLLNAAINLGEPGFRFCHISTDEVYGELKENEPAFTEEHPLSPNSPYSASKASADLLVRSYNQTYGLDTVITRSSNNYGPFQFPEKLIPLMIEKALKNQKLPVYGDGKNIRDWIYVDDHNEGVWKAYKKGVSGQVYNLGGGTELRNIQIIQSILELLEKPIDLIEYVEDRKGHDWRYAMDFSKAHKELGFSPKMDFRQGLKKTLNWYKENQAIESSR
jgi:dTDP-glucose 4,6-dehydratase